MYPNYNYYSQQSNRPMYSSQMLKGQPVSSLEEARATGIDFDGSVFFFPDLANKRIYTKQINLDGTATLNMYELTKVPVAATNENFITREEFNQAMLQIKEALPKSVEVEKETKEQKEFNF